MIGFAYASVKRFIEMFAWNTILSALIFGLYKAGVIPSTATGCFLSLLFGAVLFWLQNFRWLCRCRAEVPSKRIYFVVNYVPYAVIMAISFAVLAECNSETYTWIFAITKLWKYTRALSFVSGTVSTLISAMAFHIFTIALIWFVSYNTEHVTDQETSWKNSGYAVNDILDIINSDSLKLTDDVKKSILLSLFSGASNNDINRLIGLPLEEEEEEYD